MSNPMKMHTSGFFVLELLVAMAVMAILWLVIARYQGTALQATYNVQQRMQALNKANNLLDIALKEKRVPGKQQDVDGFTITWDVHTRPLALLKNFETSDIQKQMQFNLITVTVAWNTAHHKKSIQLTSGTFFKKELQ